MMSHLAWQEGREIMKGFIAIPQQSGLAVEERWAMMEKGGDYPKHDMLTNMLEIVKEKGEKVGWRKSDVQTELYVCGALLSLFTGLCCNASLRHCSHHSTTSRFSY